MTGAPLAGLSKRSENLGFGRMLCSFIPFLLDGVDYFGLAAMESDTQDEPSEQHRGRYRPCLDVAHFMGGEILPGL